MVASFQKSASARLSETLPPGEGGGASARKIDGGLVRAGAQRQHGPVYFPCARQGQGPQARPAAAFGSTEPQGTNKEWAKDL